MKEEKYGRKLSDFKRSGVDFLRQVLKTSLDLYWHRLTPRDTVWPLVTALDFSTSLEVS